VLALMDAITFSADAVVRFNDMDLFVNRLQWHQVLQTPSFWIKMAKGQRLRAKGQLASNY